MKTPTMTKPRKGRWTVRVIVMFDDGGKIRVDLSDADPKEVRGKVADLINEVGGIGARALDRTAT